MDGVHKTFGEFMMAKTKFMKGEILKLEKKNEQTRMTLIEKGVCLLKKKRRRKIYYVFISLFSHHLVQQSSKKYMPIHYSPYLHNQPTSISPVTSREPGCHFRHATTSWGFSPRPPCLCSLRYSSGWGRIHHKGVRSIYWGSSDEGVLVPGRIKPWCIENKRAT